MTLVGKIFTVLIFIMSLVFMSLSLMTFATHRNWKEFATNASPGPGQKLGLMQRLQQAQDLNKQLTSERDRILFQLAQERASRKTALAAMQTRLVAAESALAARQKALDDLTATHNTTAEAAKTAQERLTALEMEVQGLRDEVRVTQQDLDKKFGEVVTLTDQLNQSTGLKLRLEERNTQLALQVTRMKMVMDAKGLTEDALVSHIPPQVEGVVLAVSDKDLIEISLGADDGLKEGHVMEVFRGNTYLGRVIIRRTAPDRAVAQIVKELQRGQIKKGDNVSTKLG
ncbi:hypothetical protein Psta_1350 [Pirellula staleyi DSM 6068]|uniref:Chromosome partition protein Smc n=1 Tax=Pirellula staleyi (strain ATCC 27377 / DSM 6068 / ICPB 4128) TaxID=530564 RepID=D2QWS3_PIRSD|nr:hypothetical protein [Pirellula staleyi]ADB16027.1 hypothetical protein Psta_1350 [Pirellula staleyi DSM 6068]